MKGERAGEMGWGAPSLAVCVFNFPGPFCMQISSVIYPGRVVEEEGPGGGVG